MISDLASTQNDPYLIPQTGELDPSSGLFHRADGTYGLVGSLQIDGGDRFKVSTTAFDQLEELLWTGNSGGHVTSYYATSMGRYTSFQMHATGTESRQLLTHTNAGIMSLAKDQLKCHTRQGLHVFTHGSGNMVDMQCMLPQRDSSNIILGGHQRVLISFDVERQEEVRITPFKEHDCVLLRNSERCVMSGDTQGKISVRDPLSLDTVATLEAHSGTLSDFDVYRDRLVTCGFSAGNEEMNCDRFLMVFDLRFLKRSALPPVHLGFDPLFLRFVPVFSDSRLVVASQHGQYDVIEIGASQMFFGQIETGGHDMTCIDVSPSRQCIGFGDSGGLMHLYADRERAVFNVNARMTDFPEPAPQLPHFPFTDEQTPFSVIPLPRFTGSLASDWPDFLCKKVYRRPLDIDPAILESMRVVQFVGYAPNPGTRRRNQCPYDLKNELKNTNFGMRNRLNQRSSRGPYEDFGPVTRLYRRVYTKNVSRFSEEQLVVYFSMFNKTPHSGLDHLSANAFCNSFILGLFHLPPCRAAILAHQCLHATKEPPYCLTCELSRLYKMLQRNAGKIACSAMSFIRVFRHVPEASALGLLLNDKEEPTIAEFFYSQLIQNFARVILRHVSLELSKAPSVLNPDAKSYKPLSELVSSQPEPDEVDKSGESVESSVSESSEPEPALTPAASDVDSVEPSEKVDSDSQLLAKPPPNAIEKMFGFCAVIRKKCKCGFETTRSEQGLVTSLHYPHSDELQKRPIKFCKLLEQSLNYVDVIPSWCTKCNKYQSTVLSRKIQELPVVLSIMCRMDSEREKKFWNLQQKMFCAPPVEVVEPEPKESLSSDSVEVKEKPEDPKSLSPNQSKDSKPPAPQNPWFSDFDGKHWLSERVRIVIKDGEDISTSEITVVEVADSETGDDIYVLRNVICSIRDKEYSHLVSLISPIQNKEEAENGQKPDSKWLLFNDVAVTYVNRLEALQFPVEYKIPCVITFVKEDIDTCML